MDKYIEIVKEDWIQPDHLSGKRAEYLGYIFLILFSLLIAKWNQNTKEEESFVPFTKLAYIGFAANLIFQIICLVTLNYLGIPIYVMVLMNFANVFYIMIEAKVFDTSVPRTLL